MDETSRYASELFDQFITANTLRTVLANFKRISNLLDLTPGPFNRFFPTLKRAVLGSANDRAPATGNWKAQLIFAKLEKKAAHRLYQRPATSDSPSQSDVGPNNVLCGQQALIIGGGPCGLRTAIELQLLGAKHVLVVEKRDRISRNNVLHLWPFVIHDLKQLAGKKLYAKFCAGVIDHVSIRQLQLMLLKVALIVGCDYVDNVAFEHICPNSIRAPTIAVSTGPITTDSHSPSTCQSTTEREQSYHHSSASSSSSLSSASSTSSRSSPLSTNQSLHSKHSNHSTHSSRSVSKSRDCECCCHLHSKSGSKPESDGAFAHFRFNANSNHEPLISRLNSYSFQVLIGADGRRNTLNEHFPRKEFRGRLAIAITANFINTHTLAEAQAPEISGISFIYYQQLFKSLHEETGIDLENICYYKDDTHYFVMTAKKTSLLARKVLKQDHQDTNALLAPDNVDREKLLQYAKDAAVWSTGLQKLQFAMNHYGEADVAMFDFTSMYAAENACRAKQVYAASNTFDHTCSRCSCIDPVALPANGSNELESIGGGEPTGLLLTALVGDSLLEPFWPTGSGAGRGFLSALDAAWMCRQWALNNCWKQPQDDAMILKVLSERESVYRLLAQTTPENLSQNHSAYSLNPASRYPNLNSLAILPAQVRHLLIEGEKRPAARRTLSEKRMRRATIACPISLRDTVPDIQLRPVIRDSEPITSAFEEEETINGSTSSSTGSSRSSACDPAVELPVKRPNTLNDRDLLSKKQLQDELQQSLTSLQQSYEQLLEHERQLLLESDQSPPHKDRHMLQSWLESGMSPSACKMASLEQTRCKELDAVVRQRKLRQQMQAQEHRNAVANRFNLEDHGKLHAEQLLRNKAQWLLNGPEAKLARHQQELDSFGNSYRDFSRRFYGAQDDLPPHFANRVQQLERKLCGLDDSMDFRGKFDEDRPRESCGVNVMMARTHLQQLLDPIKQEERFRAEVKRKTFMEKEYKFVGKLTKQDWNVKCFEQGDKKDEDLSKEDLLESNPRPKERVAIFKEKLNHMQNILSGNASEIESMSDKKRLKPEEMRSSKEKCGQWIEKLKNDLNGKQNGKTIEPTVKDRRVFANVRAALCSDDLDTNVDGKESGNIRAKAFSNGKTSKHEGTSGKVHLDELEHLRNVFNQQSNYRSTKTKLVINSDSKSIKNDDKTTGRWKSTNKLSNNVGNASRSSLSSCCRCGDKVLTVDKIIVGGNHFHRSCLTCSKCGVTLRLSEVRNAINLCHEQKPALCSYECILCAKNKSNTLTSTTRGKETRAPAPNEQFVSSCSALDPKPEDEYERKLKERMKWKEMFLLNSEAAASNGISGATKTAQSPLKERIEFENSSISFELYDEDELTKMLNLDPPDSWVNPEEEEEDEEDSDEPIEMKPVNEQLSSNRKTEINSKNNDNEEEDDDDEATSTTFDESTDDDINSDQFDMSEDVEKNSIEDAELPTIVVSDEHTPPVSDDANSDSLTLNELQDVQNEAAGSLTNSRQTSTVASSSSTKSKSNSRVCSKNASPASTRTKSASPSSSGKSKSDSSSDDTFSDLNLVSVVNDTTTGASIEISRKLQTPPEDQSDWSTTIVSHYHDSELNRALIDAEPIDKDDTTTTNESTFSFRVETPKLFSSENYSKIPVLATRLDASSSPRPVYCGSFTEKLLKCRSSPTLNQQMNKSLNLTGQVNPLSPSPLGDKEPRTGSSSPTSKGPHSLGYPHFWNLSSSALLEGRKAPKATCDVGLDLDEEAQIRILSPKSKSKTKSILDYKPSSFDKLRISDHKQLQTSTNSHN